MFILQQTNKTSKLKLQAQDGRSKTKFRQWNKEFDWDLCFAMDTAVEEEQLVQEGHITPVSASRHSHTCVTTTWANGERGPLIFVFPESQFPREHLIHLNQKFSDEIWCVSSGTDTHFMDGEVSIRIWEECLAKIFAKRRERFELSLEAKGLAILERSERFCFCCLFQKRAASGNVNYTNALLFRMSAVHISVCL
jgi:hypothetical protein